MREGDTPVFHEIWSHPEVACWIGAHTREDVEREMSLHIAHERDQGWSLWAVEDRSSGELIGDCGLQLLETRGPEVELGYELHPRVWGAGLASEAARACVAHAFGALEMDALMAVVRPDNHRSRRVLERAGLHQVGERRAYEEDMLLYEAQASGWASQP
jgi:ribosomal-protein-alanine N-acetyltransferase